MACLPITFSILTRILTIFYIFSEIDDLGTEIFHLDIWDYDDDIPMREIVSKLNEGRYFKQICQSARMGCQDDFLGSVNVQICVSF